MTGIPTLEAAITVKTRMVATTCPVSSAPPPMAMPAPADMIRFFGFRAESRKPSPAPLTGVRVSMADIQVGSAGAASPRGRPRH